MPKASRTACSKRFPRCGSALGALMLGLVCLGAATIQLNPALAQATATERAEVLKAEELDQLVAPIALYPDTLLSEVLMASTYPLEVVEADRWVKQNKALKGDALKSAVDQKSWDDSVKSLAVVPDVLTMMSDKLDWTQKLGDAVLAQQPDVMDAVQRLRRKAQANNKLQSTTQQKVTTARHADTEYIVIEPAAPETIYVPYYDPAVVYGAWPYAAYPPYFFPAPGYIAAGVIATGIAFGAGVIIGEWAAHGGWWGGSVNWGNRNINIHNSNINVNNINTWVHNPDHRHGVRYNNDNVRQKFTKGDVGNRNQRMDFRGRDGEQVLHPDRPGGGNRPDLNRPGGRDLPQKGTRPGSDRASKGPPGKGRPAAGNRPNVAQRGDHGGAFNMDRGGLERAHANRGQASLGNRSMGAAPRVSRPAGGGGGMRGGGGLHRR